MDTRDAMETGTGTESKAVPLDYQSMIRIFTGTVIQSGSFVEADGVYRGVSVSAGDESSSDDPLNISCFSTENMVPGQKVRGLTCKINREVLEGIIFPSKYEPLLGMENFDTIIDSMARDFYMEYYVADYREMKPTQEFFRAKFVNDEDGRYCTGESEQSILLRAARVTECNFKESRKFVRAKYTLQDDETEIVRYLDRYYDPGSIIYILLFRGRKDKMLHTFALNGIFGPIFRSCHELFELFFNDRLFVFMCKVIHINSCVPIKPDVPIRVMITNTPRIKGVLNVFGRPVSATYHQVAGQSTNANQNTDSIVKTNDQRFTTGKIYIMTAQPAGDRYKLKRYESPEIPGTIKIEPDKTEPKPPGISGNGSETEEQLDHKELEATVAGDLPLLAIHPNEYSVMPQTSKRGYQARYIQMLVEKGTIWKLHYDILYWVGYMEFSTGILIQNLIGAGYIDGSYQDCPLSETRQIQLNSLKEARRRDREGWEDDEKIDFSLPVSIPKFSNVLSDMFEWGLLDSLRFQSEESKPSKAIIYMLSSKGSTLLQRMNRRTRPDDEFAFARSPRDIKTIISGNQLYVAYLCNLKDHVSDKESHIRWTYFAESTNSRPKFDLVFHDGDKKLNIWGESIRGYIGASKEYHLHDMYGKMERYKKTIDFLTQNNSERYCLVLVCQSYSSMKETAELVSNALGREWTCPVLLTYDIAAIGRFAESHFFLNLETAQLQKIADILEYYKDLAK